MSTTEHRRQRALRSDSIRGEGAFLPIEHVDQLHELRRAIIAGGETPQTASGVIGWLLTKNAGEADDTSGPTRSRYRKILAGIEPPDTGPKKGNRRSPIIHDSVTVARARVRPSPAAARANAA